MSKAKKGAPRVERLTAVQLRILILTYEAHTARTIHQEEVYAGLLELQRLRGEPPVEPAV